MSDTLHESHRWGTRRGIPVCLDCKVEGYEDEPGAFAECPGPPPKKGAPCEWSAWSLDDPGHLHECGVGIHPDGMHYCDECERWFA